MKLWRVWFPGHVLLIINLLLYFSRQNEGINHFALGEKITLQWLLQKQDVNLIHISQDRMQWRLLLYNEMNVFIPQRQVIYGIAEQVHLIKTEPAPQS
jgi:hypothetical protein